MDVICEFDDGKPSLLHRLSALLIIFLIFGFLSLTLTGGCTIPSVERGVGRILNFSKQTIKLIDICYKLIKFQVSENQR